jgi:hypothetical protein
LSQRVAWSAPSNAARGADRVYNRLGRQILKRARRNVYRRILVVGARCRGPENSQPARRFDTLRDAADFMFTLSERRHANPHWEHASELLMAVGEGSPAFTKEFATQCSAGSWPKG